MRSTNLKFLEDLICSDFLVYEKKKIFHLINLYETNKTLKQLIRVLQNLKQEKKKLLFFWVNSRYTSDLIQKFFATYLKEQSVCAETTSHSSKFTNQNVNLLFMLGELDLNAKSTNISLLNKAFFFVQRINSKKNMSFSDVYSVFNAIDDLKKIVFFILLIKQVLKPISNSIQ